MDATGHSGGRVGTFAVEIEPVLLPVDLPTSFEGFDVIGFDDTESKQRAEHGSNTNARFRAGTNMAAPRAPKYRRPDVPIGANLLKHCIQLIPQVDGGLKRHLPTPLGAQPGNHFREPHSLRVACSHF